MLAKDLPTLLRTPAAQFALCLLIGLAFRFSTFGHHYVGLDEDFYFYVGQAMHEGQVPYVEVWDRKPFGLFFLYYVFAAFGSSPLTYQIGAWLTVSTTAFMIVRLSQDLTGGKGSVLAGLVYVAACTALGGLGGQAELFCNLFVSAAFLLVVRNRSETGRGCTPIGIYAAMLLLGVAISIKQTAVFPAAFLGLYVVAGLVRGGAQIGTVLRQAVLFCVAGILPSALIALGYFFIGHWSEFYHAMFQSNVAKGTEKPWETLDRAGLMLIRLGPLLAVVVLSLLLRVDWRKERGFVLLFAGWAISTSTALFVVPNYYAFYALPLAVPLAVLSAPLLQMKWVGPGLGILGAVVLGNSGYPFDMPSIARSEANLRALAKALHDHSPRGTALIFDGPVSLYRMAGVSPLSPLVFPGHLNQKLEENVSHLNTREELAKILAQRPGAVVVSESPSFSNPNVKNFAAVRSYVEQNCRLIAVRELNQLAGSYRSVVMVFGDCGEHKIAGNEQTELTKASGIDR